jgi:LL-diaminopimelate aminotransferase
VQAIQDTAQELGEVATYQGYGPERGILPLREKISSTIYSNRIQADEIFVSDGAKCDIARLQALLPQGGTIGVVEPSYPAYLDSCRLFGKSIKLLPATKARNFYFDLREIQQVDALFLCSPNNPTGVAFTRAELKEIVQVAYQASTLLLFDAAYSMYIPEGHALYPRSIYEIEGATKVAIEIGSFSKMAGFSGVRLGWSVIPHALSYDDGTPLHADWLRVAGTLFNGASVLSQRGGIAALQPTNFHLIGEQIAIYQSRTQRLLNALKKAVLCQKPGSALFGLEVVGGEFAPYLWVYLNKPSWETFDLLLNTYHIVSTPGSGFGPSGDGYVRLSGFADDATINEACHRLLRDI